MINIDFKFKRWRGFKEDMVLVSKKKVFKVFFKEANIRFASSPPPSSYSILCKNTKTMSFSPQTRETVGVTVFWRRIFINTGFLCCKGDNLHVTNTYVYILTIGVFTNGWKN